MTLSIVQSAGVPSANAGSVAFALGSAPTAGNILVAFVSYNADSGARYDTPPSGAWNQLSLSSDANQDALGNWMYEVQSGDGKDWTFTLTTSGGNDYCAGYLYEITGAATLPTGTLTAQLLTASNAIQTSPAVTPDVIGMLAAAGWTINSTGVVFSSISSGWTNDGNEINAYHGLLAAHRTALTPDTSTAIDTTWTTTGSAPNTGAAITLLIAPAPAPSGPYVTQTARIPGQGTATLPFVLPSAPTVGQVLFAFTSCHGGGGFTVSPPDGNWTQVFEYDDSDGDRLYGFVYEVQPGDTADYTFTVNTAGGNDFAGGVLFEIAGADTSAASVQSAAGATGNLSTGDPIVTPGVTPGVAGMLALGCWTPNNSGMNLTSWSADWTLDAANNQGYHGSYAVHQQPLTADEVTAVSCTLNTAGQGPGTGVVATVLLAPAASPPPAATAGLLLASFP